MDEEKRKQQQEIAKELLAKLSEDFGTMEYQIQLCFDGDSETMKATAELAGAMLKLEKVMGLYK